MAKRFTDTNKWRKGFVRSLDAPYKLLWLYILDECDHAGIWHVELDVANIRLGTSISIKEALFVFDDHVFSFDNGSKWFIPDFVSFQYGELQQNNRVHESVLKQLDKYGLRKALVSPLQRAKEKEKDKAKEKAKEKEKDKDKANCLDKDVCTDIKTKVDLNKRQTFLSVEDTKQKKSSCARSKTKKRIEYPDDFLLFWDVYPKKTGKAAALKAWKALKNDLPGPERLCEAIKSQMGTEQWTEGNGRYIPYPATWLNRGQWDDETEMKIPKKRDPNELPEFDIEDLMRRKRENDESRNRYNRIATQ